MSFTAFSAWLDADTMNLTSDFKTDNQFCIYAVEFLKLLLVSSPKIFNILALPISATSSSFE